MVNVSRSSEPVCGYDAIVDRILRRGKLKRRKEDTGDLLFYILVTEVLGLLLLLRGLAHGMTPEQRVWLKDFSTAKIWDK